eukprot:1161788-Pelagomonas_calceolata.AAC.2
MCLDCKLHGLLPAPAWSQHQWAGDVDNPISPSGGGPAWAVDTDNSNSPSASPSDLSLMGLDQTSGQSFRPTLVVSCVELGQATLRQHLTPALNLSNANVPLTPQKLASLMELDQATLRQQLTCLKAKSYSLQWTGGADATQGEVHVPA